ncbi:sensor histidine kinase [Advenella mimigardefordensis]|uniref:sensor histidine kinase n=1 Tax=Advenella mimigardefordensis TaxID=302406 RepID=UPI0004B19F15|nr:ATP-binding protein [Advenella mimigardefordensis]
MQGEHQVLGVIGLQFPPDLTKLTFEQRRLAQAMVEDIGQAAIRTELVTQLEQARVVGETERLRSALLSSVSHDLRSPLSSIIGASESLRNYGKDMQEDDRLALLDGIYAEGQRLDRYIQNLLDMTRLGHDGLTLSRDWIGVDELIGYATRRLKKYMPDVIVHARIASDTGLIYAHPALLEQAIFNALENAAKFSPRDVPIVITAAIIENNAITIDIIDKGPGIPEHERRRVFDMFYSVENADSGKAGTGLGLTIVQAIVRAHMGTVEALQGEDNIGTTIRITLPSGN